VAFIESPLKPLLLSRTVWLACARWGWTRCGGNPYDANFRLGTTRGSLSINMHVCTSVVWPCVPTQLSEAAYPELVERSKRLGFTEAQLRKCLYYIRDEAPMSAALCVWPARRVREEEEELGKQMGMPSGVHLTSTRAL